ncbi:MAG: hypothetical protein LBC07_02815 [Elusimicrobiota bacterium]|jgi:hypothetical protein|nr:hypothetical protein [Elusimicrobiota bacterium]
MSNAAKIKVLLSLCFLIIFTSAIFHSPIEPTDLLTQMKTRDFVIEFPKWKNFIEPFYAFTFYVLTLERAFYAPALISWTGWILFLVLIYCIAKKKTIIQTLVRLFYGLLLFASLLAWSVFVPLDGPKLIKSPRYIAVDFHSHSRYSHDNAATELSNYKFHISAGYDYFFITEHQNTNSYFHFSPTQRKRIFEGVQMQVVEGVSVLLLSPKEFDAADYSNLSITEIIPKAHENNMLVIMPHWWKWRKFSFADLKEMGIDGFEIYNCGYRNFDEKTRESLIEFCKENNLLMTASTDWHGWGYMTDAWTVFNQTSILSADGETFVFGEPQIIIYRQKQSGTLARFIFEPLSAYYYYIKNVNMVDAFSFTAWFAAGLILIFFGIAKFIFKHIPLILSIVFTISAFYYLAIFVAVSDVNNTLPFIVIPALFAMAALWIIIWRLYDKTL